jgi:HemY protein
MIRSLFWSVLLLALLVAVLIAARFDRGYVLIAFPPWRVEMSFVVALAATFGIYVLTYVLFKLLRVTLRLPAEVRVRRERRLRARAADSASRAIAALLSAQPAHARQLAEQSRRADRSPLLALVAAYAAVEQGDVEAARAYLAEVAVSDIGELNAARQAITRRLELLTTDKPDAVAAN